jgi:hypothetical protein
VQKSFKSAAIFRSRTKGRNPKVVREGDCEARKSRHPFSQTVMTVGTISNEDASSPAWQFKMPTLGTWSIYFK